MALSTQRRAELLERVRPLAAELVDAQAQLKRPLLFGLSGAQGTGKSTIATLLKNELTDHGLRSVVLSIDDLYLTRAERARLAQDVHPLLQTRGVPGTHDIALGSTLFDRLRDAAPDTETELPVFDKAVDDRAAEPRMFVGRPAVIIFEGWCVGCRPQDASELEAPMNELESDEDAAGAWRKFVNEALAGPYAALFERLDFLQFLKAPSMDCVIEWRSQQEQELAARRAGSGSAIMNETEIRRFIMHYERLTRWMITDVPERADAVFRFDEHHQLSS